MKRKIRAAEKKLKVIQEAEIQGLVVTCRKYNIYASTYYDWKERFEEGGIEALKTRYGKSPIDSGDCAYR
jgi:transposase-like protein